MEEINGYLMSKDTQIARIDNDSVTPINEQLMPYFFLRGNPSIVDWLRTRANDNSRVNSRLLRHALKIARTDDAKASAYVNGACITDNYWIKPDGSDLTYEDVRFKENQFAMLSLHGDTNIFQYDLQKLDTHTPDLTSIGSYDKCWIYHDDAWYLQKRGTKEQIYSEMMAYEVGKRLGFNMAEYRIVDDNTIETKDFTDNAAVNFEPMQSIIGEEEFDLQKDAAALEKILPGATADFLQIQYLDAIIRNPDRHEFNYGVLRDVKTGRVTSMAPNFDNNLALIANAPIASAIRDQETGLKDFATFYNDVVSSFIVPEPLTAAEIKVISDSISVQPVAAAEVPQFIANGMEQIQERTIIKEHSVEYRPFDNLDINKEAEHHHKK
jgi:hypothetical protein